MSDDAKPQATEQDAPALNPIPRTRRAQAVAAVASPDVPADAPQQPAASRTKVRIVRGTYQCDRLVGNGDTVDVDPAEAARLVALKVAELA